MKTLNPTIPVNVFMLHTDGRDCVSYSALTDSQLGHRFLIQLAELRSIDVVDFKDAYELLQSFFAQPSLHILL